MTRVPQSLGRDEKGGEKGEVPPCKPGSFTMPPGRERERQTGKGGEIGGVPPCKPESFTMPPGRERERQTGKGGENGGILPRKPEGCTTHPERETVSETKRERPAQGGTMDGGGRAQYLHELTFALRAIESRKRRNRRGLLPSTE